MSEQELIDFFIRNRDLFHNNDILASMGRGIAWGFCKFMIILADVCKTLYDTAFGLIDFTSNEKINDFISEFQPLLMVLLALSIVALGISLIMGSEKRPKLVQNALIMILCVCCSTVVFSELNKMTLSFKNAVEEIPVTDEKADGVYDMVSDHLYDIYYYDQKLSGGMKSIDFTKKESLPSRNINAEIVSILDYNEGLDWDGSVYNFKSGAAEDILSHRLIAAVDSSSTYILGEVNTGALWTNIGNQFYYRYQMDFFPLFCQLGALIVIYVAFGYRVIRVMFELVFARLLATLYAAEVSGGERIRKILIFIRDSYILLVTTTLCIKFFFMLTGLVTSSVANTWVQGLLILFIAFCVSDGPTLIQMLIGMDAGLSGGIGKTLMTVRVASWVSNKTTSLAKHGMGLFSGLLGGKSGGKTPPGGGINQNSSNQSTDFMNGSSDGSNNTNNFDENGGNGNSPGMGGNDGTGTNGSNSANDSSSGSSSGTGEYANQGANPNQRQDYGTQDTGFMDESGTDTPLHDTSPQSPSSFMEQEPQSFTTPDAESEVLSGSGSGKPQDMMHDKEENLMNNETHHSSEKEKKLSKERTSTRRVRNADDRRWNFMDDKETQPERRSSFLNKRKDDSSLTLNKKKKGRNEK